MTESCFLEKMCDMLQHSTELPQRRFFPLPCLSYLRPYTSTWWLYLPECLTDEEIMTDTHRSAPLAWFGDRYVDDWYSTV